MKPELPPQITPEVASPSDTASNQLALEAVRAADVLARRIRNNADAGMGPDVSDLRPSILRPREVRRSGW